MGVTCDLRLIDHRQVVEGGLVAVNRALAAKDPEILREYIAGMQFTPDPAAVQSREARLQRLKEAQAPEMIVQNEERLLSLVNGEAYSAAALAGLSLGELREMLGQWGWAAQSYSLDKAWYELDWFLQPREGQGELLLHPSRPPVGDPQQTLLDQALHGAEPSPLDDSRSPIIRTCGSQQPDCFGYNHPGKAAQISAQLEQIDPESWEDVVPRRAALYQRATPSLDTETIEATVAQELEFARDAFDVMRRAYAAAAAGQFGVACEYSL